MGTGGEGEGVNKFPNFILVQSSGSSIGKELVDTVLTSQLPREKGGEMWRVDLERQTEDIQHTRNQGVEYQNIVTHKRGTYS